MKRNLNVFYYYTFVIIVTHVFKFFISEGHREFLRGILRVSQKNPMNVVVSAHFFSQYASAFVSNFFKFMELRLRMPGYFGKLEQHACP